jgi:DNA-directed RNA polymerase subunit M/transcription elongation factor TFIIS
MSRRVSKLAMSRGAGADGSGAFSTRPRAAAPRPSHLRRRGRSAGTGKEWDREPVGDYMATAHAGTTLRRTEIVSETCPQCGFGEAVCETRSNDHPRPRFRTCPHCGFAEETWHSYTRSWKGHGVYVLRLDGGAVSAGAFPGPISDEKVEDLIARFLELGAAVRYVTRWNDRENRLEVLVDQEAHCLVH